MAASPTSEQATPPAAPPTPGFGVVAEGATDFAVLRLVMSGYFADPDVVLNPVQPPPDRAGGWAEVLRYCGSEEFRQAFQFNQFVLVHIDTDACEEQGFDVSRRQPDGRVRTPDEMRDAVIARLVAAIGGTVFAELRDRIVFAVAVESIECWLLPLHWDDGARRAATTNCLGKLNEQLDRRHGYTIDAKTPRYYQRAARDYRKRSTLRGVGEENPSLRAFLTQLDELFPSARPAP